MKESRSGADYLEEVYDALSAVWDKSKFNLKKGYDDEYDCECVVITLREDPKFISKTYVIEPGDANFVAGRPTAFQTVWHFPGDHGVGVGETLEFQSTDLDDFAVEAFDYFDELKQRASRTAESKKGTEMKSEANKEDLKNKVVSDGTHDTKELVAKFLDVLEEYANETYLSYMDENPELVDDWDHLDDETLGWVLDELFDKLNEIAPEGYYFGASEGDGACFGFWSAEQDESKKKGVKSKKEDFNPSAEFYLAKGAIEDWLDRNKVVSYDYDGATVDTYHGAQPKGDWTVTWDAEDGEHTAVVHAGSFETKFNSFNDRIDLSLVKDGGKPMWYTSASDVLYALEEYINATLKGKTEAKKSEARFYTLWASFGKNNNAYYAADANGDSWNDDPDEAYEFSSRSDANKAIKSFVDTLNSGVGDHFNWTADKVFITPQFRKTEAKKSEATDVQVSRAQALLDSMDPDQSFSYYDEFDDDIEGVPQTTVLFEAPTAGDKMLTFGVQFLDNKLVSVYVCDDDGEWLDEGTDIDDIKKDPEAWYNSVMSKVSEAKKSEASGSVDAQTFPNITDNTLQVLKKGGHRVLVKTLEDVVADLAYGEAAGSGIFDPSKEVSVKDVLKQTIDDFDNSPLNIGKGLIEQFAVNNKDRLREIYPIALKECDVELSPDFEDTYNSDDLHPFMKWVIVKVADALYNKVSESKQTEGKPDKDCKGKGCDGSDEKCGDKKKEGTQTEGIRKEKKWMLILPSKASVEKESAVLRDKGIPFHVTGTNIFIKPSDSYDETIERLYGPLAELTDVDAVEAKQSEKCVSERAIPGGKAFLQKMSDAGLQDVLDKMSSKGITFELTNTDGPIYAPGYAIWNGYEGKRFVGNLYQCKRSQKSGDWEGPIFLGWDKKLDIPYVYVGGAKYEGMFGSRNPFEQFMRDLDTGLSESLKNEDSLADMEIQVRKPGEPWCRWTVTWPEYVKMHKQDAIDRGYPEVRVLKLKPNSNIGVVVDGPEESKQTERRLNPVSIDAITKDDFDAYVAVQRSGKYNMIMDADAAADDADLDIDTYYGIIKNYGALVSKYGRKGESLSESLTLKQKELKDMARFGQAEDITTISDEEAKALRKKGIETIGVSRGTYGMNGALLRDNEGKKYVITSRSSNLFYFV